MGPISNIRPADGRMAKSERNSSISPASSASSTFADEVKEQRWHRLMQHQQAILQKRLKRKIGGREKVIIDEVGSGGAKGRSKGDAPQIDGTVHVRSHRPLRIGEIATVKIERADAYDLHGSVVGC